MRQRNYPTLRNVVIATSVLGATALALVKGPDVAKSILEKATEDRAFIVAEPGDTRRGLYLQEGWTPEEINQFEIYNPNLQVGDVVEVWEKGDPNRFLGDTKRMLYDSREEAQANNPYK